MTTADFIVRGVAIILGLYILGALFIVAWLIRGTVDEARREHDRADRVDVPDTLPDDWTQEDDR